MNQSGHLGWIAPSPRHGDDVVFKVFETLIMALPSLDKERKEHFLLQKPFVMGGLINYNTFSINVFGMIIAM